jgi:pentapeptide MXKDX repeat protein
MAPRFGRDFSQVRVHQDARAAASAEAVGAQAYTVGRNIVFGEGRYAPQSSAGKELLAHELTHVVQQSAAGSGEIRALDVESSGERLERQAESVSRGILLDHVSTSSANTIPLGMQRQPLARRKTSKSASKARATKAATKEDKKQPDVAVERSIELFKLPPILQSVPGGVVKWTLSTELEAHLGTPDAAVTFTPEGIKGEKNGLISIAPYDPKDFFVGFKIGPHSEVDFATDKVTLTTKFPLTKVVRNGVEFELSFVIKLEAKFIPLVTVPKVESAPKHEHWYEEPWVTDAVITIGLVALAVVIPVAVVLVAESLVAGAVAAEVIATETLAAEAAMTEAAMTEAAMTEAAMTEAAMTEAAMTEAAMTEAAMTEAAMTEAAITEGVTTEAVTTEAVTEKSAIQKLVQQFKGLEGEVLQKLPRKLPAPTSLKVPAQF